MDANYVMDETLGTAKYSLSKLKVGQTEKVTLSIGKVKIQNAFCSDPGLQYKWFVIDNVFNSFPDDQSVSRPVLRSVVCTKAILCNTLCILYTYNKFPFVHDLVCSIQTCENHIGIYATFLLVSSASTDLRFSMALCDQEKLFMQARRDRVMLSIKKLLKMENPRFLPASPREVNTKPITTISLHMLY